MVEDTLDDALDDDELEDDAQEEVDKVLFELTAGTYTNMLALVPVCLVIPASFLYEHH